MNLNDKTFAQVTRTGESLVMFTAQWCGPCKLMRPRVMNLEKIIPVHFMDVDESPKAVQAFGIRKVPSLLHIKTGIEKGRLEGVQTEGTILAMIRG